MIKRYQKLFYVLFYLKLAEGPGVAPCPWKKFERKKNLNFFSLCPQNISAHSVQPFGLAEVTYK